MLFILNICAVTVYFCTGVLASLDIGGIPNYFPSALRVAHSDHYVAFSAGLTQRTDTTTPTNITYDRVFLNVGGGYDSTTGVFTCPHAGTYAFLFHGVSQTASQLNLDLYHNLRYIVSAFAHARSEFASAHQAMVLNLKESDTVHIQGRGVNSLFGKPREVYATFSGFMVIPDAGDTGNNLGNIIG